MKTSWRRLQLFSRVADHYVAEHPNETKLKYALERVQSQIPKIQTVVHEKLGNIEIDCCSVDDRQNILRDAQGNLQFTKENLKKRNSETAKLLDAEDVEIEPHFCQQVPEGLSALEESAFAGLVVKETALAAS